MVTVTANDFKAVSSATYKWGTLVLDSSTAQWATLGFSKTEKAAKTLGVATGREVFLVARRFTQREARSSRNMG